MTETPNHPDPAGGADLMLDCLGMRCPLPVIELARRIGEVDVSGSVAVVTDDPAAATDVPAWCRLQGQEYVGSQAKDHATTYLVRRLH